MTPGANRGIAQCELGIAMRKSHAKKGRNVVRSTLSLRRRVRLVTNAGLLVGSLVFLGQLGPNDLGQAAVAQGVATEVSIQMLIESAELEKRLREPQLRLLDTRSAEEYAQGHIPGAILVDVKGWQELGRQEGGFHDAEAWSTKVGQLGITHESQVVVYGSNLTDTARIWWTLKYLGLRDVSLLNGGWSVWVAQQRPVDNERPGVEVTRFEPQFQADRLEEIDSLKQSLDDGAVTVVDARSDGEFTGEEARGPRGGHIPGAKHLEWKELLDDDGRFKTPEQLQAIFRQRGITPEQTAVTC